jgi:hypothetical protein
VCDVGEEGQQQVSYWRLEADRKWEAASLAEFLKHEDPCVPTAVFVHGNRYDADTAIDAAWYIYGHIAQQGGGKKSRFVIWSWPSDQIRGGNRRDVQTKATWADRQTYYLAGFLQSMHGEVPVSLIGFSFGARIVTGALHLLGGGEISGFSLPNRTEAPRLPVNAILVAAALDADWLLPGHCHGMALSQVHQLLITENASDSALRWYPRMYRHRGPDALGFFGLPCASMLGEEQNKIEQMNLSCAVGKTHDWACYASVPDLGRRVRDYTFRDSTTVATPSAPSEAIVELTAR